MRSLDLTLTLIDDLVASERPATEGGHESLDYLPGSMFLGAVASRLYARLERGDAYRLFHSGAVRFGDGVPLAQGHPCWPMPLSWHEAKGKGACGKGDILDPDMLWNLQHGDLSEGQPKQLRDGSVRADGYCHWVPKALRMKTAIDPRTGRVAEAQLFGYEAIQAGQVYAVRIEADDDLPQPLWKAVTDLFAGSTEVLLGRSRSAEYGRVRVEMARQNLDPPESAEDTPADSLTLWCLSDLALMDPWGQPTLAPQPKHFGLDRGKLDPDGTFLRFRRFAPWNAYRRAHDLQRQVIRRGSIIAFAGIDPPLTKDERQHLAAGVGLHREQGLGRVCLDPQLMATLRPDFADPFEGESSAQPAPRPEHPLIAWLEGQTTGGATRRAAEEQSKALARELSRRYSLARAYAGIPDALPIGPSPAQWGSVYEAARTANDIAALRRTLFEGDNAVCKPRGENWQDQFRDGAGVRSFRDWFHYAVQGQGITVETLRRFGREAQRIAQGQHGRGDRQGRTA
jgi:CRISPR-associated protein Csx10